MTENELISKFKDLKSIQPDKKWVLTTKTQILGEPQREQFSLNWLTNRAFLAVPALIAILIAGIFFYNRNIVSPEIAFVDSAALEAITTGLKTIESNIVHATVDLEKVKEPKRVLQFKEALDLTIESGEKVVDAVKKIVEEPKDKKSPEVLAALTDMESALQDMKEIYAQKQKELAKELIEDLENRELTEEQETLLENAKNYYNEGNFAEALIKAIEVSQER